MLSLIKNDLNHLEKKQEKKQEKCSVVDIKKLPCGQRLRRLGYRVITDLEKELNCDKILGDYVATQIELVKKKLKKEYGNDILLDVSSSISILGRRRYYVYNYGKSILKYLFRFLDDYTPFLSCKYESIRSVECVVKTSIIENYMGDNIPIEMYDKIEQAKKEGLRDFYVAYPEIERVKQTDPIIYTYLGDQMIFIGQWD